MSRMITLVATPALDDDLRLGEAVEDLAVEKLVAELRVEAPAILRFRRRSPRAERSVRVIATAIETSMLRWR